VSERAIVFRDLGCFYGDSTTNILCPSCQTRLSMTFDLYLGGLIALALALYLGYALFHPEKF